jgi:hypothetical protein
VLRNPLRRRTTADVATASGIASAVAAAMTVAAPIGVATVQAAAAWFSIHPQIGSVQKMPCEQVIKSSRNSYYVVSHHRLDR